MVKPYFLKYGHLQGWREAGSQALYHAAGIGDHHQDSFVVGHAGHPATVIRLDPAKEFDRAPVTHIKKPAFRAAVAKIALMDYLTGNHDRHVANLMVRPGGSPMVVDNADAFTYRDHGADHKRFVAGAPQGSPELADWWKSARPAVDAAMRRRLDLIHDPEVRDHIQRNFEARASRLDGHDLTSLSWFADLDRGVV
jgi:hypothetical protein